MWTSDASGRANLPDDLSSRHHVAFVHGDDGQMGEQRKHAEAMVDHDGIAGEIEIMGEQNASAVRRMDRSARRTEKIGAAVWLSCFAVEHTP